MKRILLTTMVAATMMFAVNAQNSALQLTSTGDNTTRAFFTVGTADDGGFMGFKTTSVTMEAWVKTQYTEDLVDYTGIVDGRYTGNSDSKGMILKQLSTETTQGTLAFEYEGAWTYQDDANAIPADTWTHVAMVVDGDAELATFYINGVPTGTNAKGDNAYDNIGAEIFWDVLYIGTSNGMGERAVIGMIDEVRVWQIARTEAEINDNMTKELEDAFDANLLAYYPCNEESGAVTLTDATLQGNDGDISAEGGSPDAATYDFVELTGDENWIEEEIAISSNKYENNMAYPNPASTVIRFKGLNSSEALAQVFDITGKLVNETTITMGSMNIETLNNGVYQVQITQGSESFNTMFIKK